MDATRDSHTKWSKSERERQIPYDITYMWNLKYDTNEPIYETQGHREQAVVAGVGRGLGEGWSGRLGLAGVSYYT